MVPIECIYHLVVIVLFLMNCVTAVIPPPFPLSCDRLDLMRASAESTP